MNHYRISTLTSTFYIDANSPVEALRKLKIKPVKEVLDKIKNGELLFNEKDYFLEIKLM